MMNQQPLQARPARKRRRVALRFGRPPKLTPYQRQEALQRLAAGETQADIARAAPHHVCGHCRLGNSNPSIRSSPWDPGRAPIPGFPCSSAG
jgi:hypothetical protein